MSVYEERFNNRYIVFKGSINKFILMLQKDVYP